MPCVAIDPVDLPDPDVPGVGVTNWSGGPAATRHLIQLGHRRIAVIGGPPALLCSRARLDGYRAAQEQAGLPSDPALVRDDTFHHQGAAGPGGVPAARRPDLRRVVGPGALELLAGPSAGDLPLRAALTVTGPEREVGPDRVLDTRHRGGHRYGRAVNPDQAHVSAPAGPVAAGRRVACAGAVVHDAAGRLLVIRRGTEPGRGRWSIPGGRCEPGEDAATTAVRETREETGLVVVAGAAAGRVERPGPGGVTYVIDDVVCTPTGGTLAPGDDATDARWVTAAELAALPLVDGLLEALTDWTLLPRPGG
jgi:ADP-ribose pyrophosphatase YjhB (NUDIX family)